MPDRPAPFGSDTLVIPASFSRSPADPALARWKLEHPDWFEAGTWDAPRRARAKTGVMSQLARLPLPAWTRETREIEREQWARGRPRSEAEWLQQALATATLPIGLSSIPDPGEFAKSAHVDLAPYGPFALYPPEHDRQHGSVHRISDGDDEIKQQIREVGDRIHAIAETALRFDAQFLDREGSAAAFGSRLHKLFGDDIRNEHIPGVEVESSFNDGDPARYGDPSSVRTDVLLRINGQVVAVWDFKTGTTPTMPESRKQQLRANINSQHPDIPADVIYMGFYRDLPWW